MYPYFLLLLTILILQVKFHRRYSKDVSFVFAVVLLFLFAAFRGNGKGDYFAYLRFAEYVTMPSVVFDSGFPMEFGFRAIAYLVNVIGLHPQAVIALMNLISLTCIYHFVKNYSSDKMLSLLAFLPLYFQLDMHAARTAVAVSISTLSLGYLLDKKAARYFLVIFLASLFHRSVLILVPTYFAVSLRVDKLLGFLIVLTVGALSILVSFSTIVLRLGSILGLESLVTRFYIYTQSLDYGYAFSLLDPRFLLVLTTYFLTILVLKGDDRFHTVLTNYIWLNTLLIIIFREHTVFVTRLTSFFNVYTIILIPEILKNLKISSWGTYGVFKLGFTYIYLAYTSALLIGSVEYRLFWL